MFKCITRLTQSTTALNSTAVATADVSMSGSVVQCIAGSIISNFSVGNITLCIVGELIVYVSYIVMHLVFTFKTL